MGGRSKEKKRESDRKYREKNKDKLSKYHKKYREENKDKLSKYHKKFYEQNKNKKLEYQKKFYEQNKDKLSKYHKKYREENKDKISERDKKYCEQNKDKISERKKKYYEQNKDKLSKYHKKYCEQNKDKKLEYYKKYRKRKSNNPTYRLNRSIRNAIYKSMKRHGINKGGRRWESLVGYTLENLQQHLESKFNPNMTWENYGSYWHVDHIIPLASFTFESYDDPQFKLAWALSNLQPLERSENTGKGNRFDHPSNKKFKPIPKAEVKTKKAI